MILASFQRKSWECFSFSPLYYTAVSLTKQAMDYAGFENFSNFSFYAQEGEEREMFFQSNLTTYNFFCL